MEPTNIEKKSLETHVELCTERYRFLEKQVTDINASVEELDDTLKEIRHTLYRMDHARDSRMIAWGGTIIACLLGVIGWLFQTYVLT